jgi:hypothetical protein
VAQSGVTGSASRLRAALYGGAGSRRSFRTGLAARRGRTLAGMTIQRMDNVAIVVALAEQIG